MTVYSHLKITAANKDGIVYCLGSPDKFVMHEKVYGSKYLSISKILLQPDRSCNRDKVNGAAADAHAPMVFATQLRKLYREKILPAHLEGRAKSIYAATQAATKLYRRPLAFMRRPYCETICL